MPELHSSRLGVLISGRGSNLQALIDAIQAGNLAATIALVISNHEEAPGLARAREAGIEAIFVSHRGWDDRENFDRVLARELRARRVGLVCLAGFMRRVGRPLLEAFPDAVLNIHPALLPSFPGLDAQAQALAHGVKVSGVTVHFVTEEVDAGPIILQRTVPVLDEDTPATLADRILLEEHRAYPEAVARVLAGGWRIEGRRFVQRPAATPIPPVRRN